MQSVSVDWFSPLSSSDSTFALISEFHEKASSSSSSDNSPCIPMPSQTSRKRWRSKRDGCGSFDMACLQEDGWGQVFGCYVNSSGDFWFGRNLTFRLGRKKSPLQRVAPKLWFLS